MGESRNRKASRRWQATPPPPDQRSLPKHRHHAHLNAAARGCCGIGGGVVERGVRAEGSPPRSAVELLDEEQLVRGHVGEVVELVVRVAHRHGRLAVLAVARVEVIHHIVPGQRRGVDHRQRVSTGRVVDGLPAVVPGEACAIVVGGVQPAPLQELVRGRHGVLQAVVAMDETGIGLVEVRRVLGAHDMLRDEHLIGAGDLLGERLDLWVVRRADAGVVAEVFESGDVGDKPEAVHVEAEVVQAAAGIEHHHIVLAGVGSPRFPRADAWGFVSLPPLLIQVAYLRFDTDRHARSPA